MFSVSLFTYNKVEINMPQQGSGGNVIAAICNIFIPGLGQLVQGRILGALMFFIILQSVMGLLQRSYLYSCGR